LVVVKTRTNLLISSSAGVRRERPLAVDDGQSIWPPQV